MNDRLDITYVEPAAVAVSPPGPALRRLPAWMRKFRAVMLALGLVLVLRAVFVEPFSVPTGSMAPHIFGVHREKTCWNCGIPVRVGELQGISSARYFDVPCPNCGAGKLEIADQPSRAGDRMLVDKSTFGWRAPRRWELAVFRGPTEPDQPYVKRVVGLSNEAISIRDGDVFVNDDLARKTLRQAQALGVPLCQMVHVPGDGWAARWPAAPGDGAPRTSGAEIVFPLPPDNGWREIQFQREDQRPIDDGLTYNGRRPDLPLDWVHDFLIECEVSVDSGTGAVEFILTDGGNDVTVSLSPTDAARMTAGDQSRDAGDWRLRPGRSHRLEMAFVDRRACAHCDGAPLGEPIDLPVLVGRQPVVNPVRIRARQLGVTIRNLGLSRDLHYLSRGLHGVEQFQLGVNEYFMLGDNTVNSEDSRFWPRPGVPARDLMGKPLFRYSATNLQEGVVFGRAWFSKTTANDRFGWIR